MLRPGEWVSVTVSQEAKTMHWMFSALRELLSAPVYGDRPICDLEAGEATMISFTINI